MTRAIRLFWVGGSSRSRVYCSASPVNVPPAIHCSFLTALHKKTDRPGSKPRSGSWLGQSAIGPEMGPRSWGCSYSLKSWALRTLGLLMSTCSCIWLWLYCTTPAWDCPGSNCGNDTIGSEVQHHHVLGSQPSKGLLPKSPRLLYAHSPTAFPNYFPRSTSCVHGPPRFCP